MLSLDKTKEVPVLQEWLGSQKGLLSWKLDGLTIVLTYEGGELVKAVTRGNGEIGEVITNNAKVFSNVPLRIPYQGQLILRGARPSSNIPILPASTRKSRMWMQNIKTRETYAADRCAS